MNWPFFGSKSTRNDTLTSRCLRSMNASSPACTNRWTACSAAFSKMGLRMAFSTSALIRSSAD